MASPVVQAIKQICEEKGLAYESVLETVEAALASAYRKDFGNKLQNVKIEFDPETGAMRAFDVKTVVRDFTEEELEALKSAQTFPAGSTPDVSSEAEQEKLSRQKSEPEGETRLNLPVTDGNLDAEEEKEKFNPKTMIMVSEAQKIKPEAVLDEELRIELPLPGAFGRMAAQTAKQVITQRLREAERQVVLDEWTQKTGTLVTGIVGRREGRLQFVDVGKVSVLLPPSEQVESETYLSGARLKFYIKSVTMTSRGPEIIGSRSAPEMVKELFRTEIPEVASGIVEIKAVAREAGWRTKIAVTSQDPQIDPIGSCVGQRGGRIQTVISELGGEKIDIVQWNATAEKFISAALAPAKVLTVELHDENKQAKVRVAPQELSLAIGRGGQNVRLASELTGWNITIAGEGEGETLETLPSLKEAVPTEPTSTREEPQKS